MCLPLPATGESPPATPVFPICETRGLLDKVRQRTPPPKCGVRHSKDPLRHLAAHQQARIERYQPFNATPTNPSSDPLSLLKYLSNGDKHRDIALVASSIPRPPEIWLTTPTDVSIEVLSPWSPDKANAPMLRLYTANTSDVTVDGDLEVFVTFIDAPSQLIGRGVLPTLEQILRRVKWLAWEFEPDFR